MSDTLVVYKYPLEIKSGPQTLDFYAGAKLLHVHEQGDKPVIWAEVNPTAPPAQRVFHVIATGFEPVPIGASYVGTVHIGWTVWHVYEALHG